LRLRSRIFQQLDELKPLPYQQLQRGFPTTSPASREQKGLILINLGGWLRGLLGETAGDIRPCLRRQAG
jgi:hypothetical protein